LLDEETTMTTPGTTLKDRSAEPSATADTRQRFRPSRVDFADFKPRHFLWQRSGKVRDGYA